MALDVALVMAMLWVAYWLRFEDIWPPRHKQAFFPALLVFAVLHVVAYLSAGMYRQVWRYANYQSALLIARAVFFGEILSLTGCYLLELSIPRSIYIIHGLLATTALGLVRFSWRSVASYQLKAGNKSNHRCLIYGAGSGGDLLARHILANPKFPYHAVGFIDDDRNKRGRLIQGMKILGTSADLEVLCEEYGVTTIILAMPSVPGKLIREVVARCHTANVKPLIMPDMATSLGENVFQPRPIDIRDLLKRAPKSIDEAKIRSFFEGRTVLVTGAGGSIGSEICRQVLRFKPKRLVMLDSSEFNLYKIETEIEDSGSNGVEVHAVLGSAVDRRLISRLFRTHSFDYVLHAAAFKHVPIIERNPIEGVLNNVLGTQVLAEAAIANGVKRFLLISSDKAVRPSNVMGMTKRCCEVLIQSLQAANPKRCGFAAVRFGNVLGSSGSVIPRFLQQIQAGGPVTVTHRDVTRYFMLTSEAVGLVLQSIAMSEGGETFVLNMGDPVNIYEMARQLIILSGKEPEKDIEILVTGLRPGEKLYEELILESAERHTLHDDVYVARPLPFDPALALAELQRLVQAAKAEDSEGCLAILRQLSFEAQPSETVAGDELVAPPLH